MFSERNIDELQPSTGSWAFFFDLDGTLAPLVDRPELACVPEPTKATLRRLHQASDGALAVISGRPLAALDDLLQPLILPVAAEHGAIVRDAGGHLKTLAHPSGDVQDLADWLAGQLGQNDGLLVERKAFGVALHYRLAPQEADTVSALMARAAQRFPQFELMAGKMVFEAKLPSVDKGRALAHLARTEPFLGRTPLMVGDDTTDEAAFRAANALDGYSIKIGPGDSCALYRLDSPAALASWLAQL